MSKTKTQSDALELAEFFGSMKKSSHRWYDGVPVHEKAAAELRRLDAENNALRADAERYHHLRDCNSGSLVVMQITGTGEDDWHVLTEGDADEAIDAAMASMRRQKAAEMFDRAAQTLEEATASASAMASAMEQEGRLMKAPQAAAKTGDAA